MLLKILKSNKAYNLILFPFLGILLWASDLISPGTYNFSPGEDQTVLFEPVLNLTRENPLIQVLIALVLVIILGFLLQKINSQYSFYNVRTILPSYLLILLAGGVSSLHNLHPVYFAAAFFALAIDRSFGAFEKKTISSNSFDTGFILGIGSLFYANLILLFPAFIIGLRIINPEYNWRNLSLSLLGLLLPWIFAFSYFFVNDNTSQLFHILLLNVGTKNNLLDENLSLQIYSGFWMFILFVSSLVMLRNFDREKISTRRYFGVFIILWLSLAGIFYFVPFASIEVLVLLAVPSSFIIANLLLSIKSKFWGNFILIIIAAMVIYMQFV